MMEHENGHHPYHTRIPNTIIKGEKGKGLSVYARWLYVYLKSVAGDDGQCFQSTTKLATESGLSRMSISRAKQELVASNLIIATPGRRTNRDAESIRIRDIWKENTQEFSQCTTQVRQEVIEEIGGPSSGVPTGYSGVPTGYSGVPTGYSGVPERNGDYIERARIKKIPLRRSLEEEREDTPLFTDAVNSPPAPVTKTMEIPPISQKTRKKKHEGLDTAYTPGFQSWWSSYPSGRKTDKPQCFDVWKAHNLEARTAEQVEKLEHLKLTTWKDCEPRYIKTSLPYLNSGRFEDDLVPLPLYPTPQEAGLSEKEYRTAMSAHKLIQEIQGDTRRQPALLSSTHSHEHSVQ